jgi:hypothetical protein
MAGPLAGVSAAQIAQQKIQDQGAQQVKQGPSKFDGALKANKAQGAEQVQQAKAAQQAQAAQATQKTDHVRQIEQVNKTQKASLSKVNGSTTAEKVTPKQLDPVAQKSEVSKSTGTMANMLSEMEKGGSMMDKLIKGGLSGKNISNQELLSMQAGMYKYTQELELTGKVVEKATSGLKDTLKTQV